jgi:ADP-ribosylglycohydrolase
LRDTSGMTLAVHDALTDCAGRLDDVPAVTAALIRRYREWSVDPDNDRAPGNACMTSIGRVGAGAAWFGPRGAETSAGCGAVMRLVPAAFAPAPVAAGLTALQAVITHNHPRAVVPALLLAAALADAPARRGHFLETALASAAAIRRGTDPLVTDPFLTQVLAPVTDALRAYLVDGLDDGTEQILAAASAVLRQRRTDRITAGDLCAGVGEGWESASAVALALLVADLATGPAPVFTPAEALAWAATTNGDSDSIACIAGAVLGAADPAPDFWIRHGVAPSFEPRYAGPIATAQPVG